MPTRILIKVNLILIQLGLTKQKISDSPESARNEFCQIVQGGGDRNRVKHKRATCLGSFLSSKVTLLQRATFQSQNMS
ncbi:hypothetical protein I8748_31735 [Nostoc sp. CENA67]|uniref:Uncharacterized protein n=1 Tax=Amazonocrinis nigriterrae CENA67 TaxID=2794033 RepID=A0A8J7I061_9NOST|nr:hypothetical protein [Amazonocrinis nigriterrae]MBH8566672.1 hypothetical protein [Amazonocrinis nigriterrae CENA67]